MLSSEAVILTIPQVRYKPRDYRCASCGRLLFRAVLNPGCYVECRCPKCGSMNVAGFAPENGREILTD